MRKVRLSLCALLALAAPSASAMNAQRIACMATCQIHFTNEVRTCAAVHANGSLEQNQCVFAAIANRNVCYWNCR